MRWWGELKHGLRVLAGRKAADQSVDDEIAHYMELTAKALEDQGVDPREARRRAVLEVGNPAALRQQVRENAWENGVENFFSDLRHSARRLIRKPGFVAACALTLALGIGATTAIFAVIYAVLLKPLPYAHSERLVSLWHTAPGVGIERLEMAPAQYFYYRQESRSFESVALWTGGVASLSNAGANEEIQILQATHEFLPLLGARPALGRAFTAADDDPAGVRTVMLSDAFWRQRFQGDPDAVGRTLTLDGEAYTVIGVLPADLQFTDRRFSLLRPMRFSPHGLLLSNFSFPGLARLRPGVTLEQASADIRRMLERLPERFPPPPSFGMKMLREARIAPRLQYLKDDFVGSVGQTLWLLMGTLGLLLLIACANVANLLLVRAGGRAHELSVRAALGAGRGRLARELLLESLLLGLVGGALGLLLAQTGLQTLVASDVAGLPRLAEVRVDATVVAFTFGLSLLTSLGFGLLPVWKYARLQGSAPLRESGRTAGTSRDTSRTRHALVVGQVALALVLVVSAGLMLRTVRALYRVDAGFSRPAQALTVRISFPQAQVHEDERVAALEKEILSRLNTVPGYAAAAINQLPLEGGSQDPIFASDRNYAEGAIPAVRRFKFVSPDYVRALGARLVAGREFTWSETLDARRMVLVSENLARELWGKPHAALGRRVRSTLNEEWSEVVGVVSDLRDDGVDQPAPAVVYWPLLQRRHPGGPLSARRSVALVVRSETGTHADQLDQVRGVLSAVAPFTTVAGIRGLDEILERSLARRAFALTLLGLAGGTALLLGLIGIYGVLAYSVSQRTREIGIRLALGAPLPGVTSLFLRHGLQLSLAGVLCGLAAAYGLSRLMRAVLFDVSPTDPLTYAAASAALVAAALLASYIPARRAARVDPMRTLRAE